LASNEAALLKVCGISLLERLLRNLQRVGVAEVSIVSQSDGVRSHLLTPSWARAGLHCALLAETGDLTDSLIIPADGYYDPRLLKALLIAPHAAVLVDSAPPSELLPSLDADQRTAEGWRCGPVITSAGDPTIIDVAAQSTYVAGLRRDLRPLWFPAPRQEGHRLLAEGWLLDAAQNGTLDLPAKVHAPIETWIIARLCRTNVTPNQITLFTAAVSAGVTALFASGQLLAGVGLALIVGVLDGLDGKQARVKVETTQLGKREHVLDYVLELSWWSALAYHFTATAQLPNAMLLLVLLVGSDLVDRLAKRFAKKRIDRNLDDHAPIDRFVRLIGGRRNIYVWILAAGLAAGIPDKAFVALCWWGALTATVHVLRACSLAGKRVSN
jgi:phosphatidylglycerophosphate synthase